MLLGCFLAAFIGDQVGYAFGKKVGPSIFKRPDSRWFKHENVERAEEFFEHHGSKTIILARFVPVVRTFAPIVAGVSSMRYRTFVFYNVIGAFLWAVGVTLLGYWLGNTVPNIDKYLLPIIFGIIVVSLVPVFVEYRRQTEASGRDADVSPTVDEPREDCSALRSAHGLGCGRSRGRGCRR